MNTAFVFVKPHAASNGKVRELVQKHLEAAGCSISSAGEILAEKIDKENLVDVHYYSIASKAVLQQPNQLPVPADKFKEKFGIDWDDALEKGLCYNAQDAGKKFGLDASELERKWGEAKTRGKMIKFGGGFYCAEIDGSYIFNGFFMSMRNKYVQSGRMIYYMKVEFDPKTLSWSDFRLKVLGATDPSKAVKESLRGTLFAKWESLGLATKPDTGDNGVHASASPFEALGERMNWCGDEMKSDPFGKELLASGIDAKTITAWTRDPRVVIEESGKTGSLFDVLDGLDYEECLAAIVSLYKLNQPVTTVDDVKQVEDTKQVEDAKQDEGVNEAKDSEKPDVVKKVEDAVQADDAKVAENAEVVEDAVQAEAAEKVEVAVQVDDAKVAESAENPDIAAKADAEKPKVVKADDSKSVEDAKVAEDANKADVAKKVEVEVKAEVAKVVEDTEKPDEAKKAAVAKVVEDTKVADQLVKDVDKPDDAKKAEDADKGEDTAKVDDEKKAEVVDKATEVKTAEDVEKAGDANKAETAEKTEDANKPEDTSVGGGPLRKSCTIL